MIGWTGVGCRAGSANHRSGWSKRRSAGTVGAGQVGGAGIGDRAIRAGWRSCACADAGRVPICAGLAVGTWWVYCLIQTWHGAINRRRSAVAIVTIGVVLAELTIGAGIGLGAVERSNGAEAGAGAGLT